MTVAARGGQNSLRLLQFGSLLQPLLNASVMVPGYPRPITTETTLQLQPWVPERSFIVQRVLAGQPIRAPITVVDACAAWQVVVSGGTDDDLTVAPGTVGR